MVGQALTPTAALEDIVLIALKSDFVTHTHRIQGAGFTIHQHRVRTVAR